MYRYIGGVHAGRQRNFRNIKRTAAAAIPLYNIVGMIKRGSRGRIVDLWASLSSARVCAPFDLPRNISFPAADSPLRLHYKLLLLLLRTINAATMRLRPS